MAVLACLSAGLLSLHLLHSHSPQPSRHCCWVTGTVLLHCLSPILTVQLLLLPCGRVGMGGMVVCSLSCSGHECSRPQQLHATAS